MFQTTNQVYIYIHKLMVGGIYQQEWRFHQQYIYIYICIYGRWLTHPSEKYGQLGLLSPIYGKIKNVPKHQPGIYIYIHKLMVGGIYQQE